MLNTSSNNDNTQLLENLRLFITNTQEKILTEQERVKKLHQSLANLRSPSPVDFENRRNTEKRAQELEQIYGSPFFTKCVLVYPEENKIQTLFFGKHQFSSEDIFSWVAPIASIRFEQPGNISYTRPDGEVVHAKLVDKEQYMIVDGKVIFFAKETENSPRQLIHHDYFSSRKGTFELPEIVAVMEKAQDAVIRAHHAGSFVISGPAGSGKTTLAFHRIAYLLQSPDTMELYSPRSVVIFVQDASAKDYFSHLLPNLGINNVKIVTFFEWASDILQLSDVQFVQHFGNNDTQRNLYEFEKIRILRALGVEKFNSNIFSLLQSIYSKHFSKEFNQLFSEQKKVSALDRIDITIALIIYLKTYKKFETIRTFNVIDKTGVLKKKQGKNLIEYSLMLIDEFQNYLPEQLSLLNQCLRKDTKSMIYVGDINQQIRLGTIRSFEQIDEKLTPDRNVILHKVYRNTKQILQYIGELGYKIEIPQNIKEGPIVVEKIITNKDEVYQYVQNLILNNPDKSIGVLSKNIEGIEFLKGRLPTDKKVHICTIIESQGVEFDLVCIVGEWKELFKLEDAHTLSLDFILEKKRIHQDLLYVALTRASEEMHIIGDSLLSESIVHSRA